VSTLTRTSNDEAAALQPVLGERCALTPRHVVACGVLAVLFMYLNYQPLFHTDLWGHVLYGQWMLEHGRLPAEDPFLPLAEGMPATGTSWLGQLALGAAEACGGSYALSLLYAGTYWAAFALLARVFYLQAKSLPLALIGMAGAFLMLWTRHAVIRPEMFGALSLAVLFWLLVRVEPWKSRAVAWGERSAASGERIPLLVWVATPPLFVFWANVHGSFAVGLAILGCHVLGRGCEVLWSTRRLQALLFDRQWRQLVLLTELALAATLINPYGLNLLIETARFGANPNLPDVLEWYPLKLKSVEGILFGGSLVLAMVLLRSSRVAVRPAEVLVLLVLAIGMAGSVRLISWYGPCFVFAAMPHVCDLWRRRFPQKRESSDASGSTPRHFAWTLISGLILWCAFALSPVSQPLLSAAPRERERVYSNNTPLELTAYLREHPPQGLVWAPQWWGDWIVYDGPRGIQVSMMTHVHLVPHSAWRDYLRAARGQPGWQRVLDRYGATTLIVDKDLQKNLARQARRAAPWRVVHEDAKSLVLRRAAADG